MHNHNAYVGSLRPSHTTPIKEGVPVKSMQRNVLLTTTLFACLLLVAVAPALPQVGPQEGRTAAPEAAKGADNNPSLPRGPVAGSKDKTTKIAPFGNLMIVYFEEPGLLHYSGDLSGLEATRPMARGERKLDARSPASRAYLRHLDQRQSHYLGRMRETLGRDIRAVFEYRAAVSGVAVAMTPAEGKLVEKIPGVKAVFPDKVAPLDTDRGP